MSSDPLSLHWRDVSVPLDGALPTWPGDPALVIGHFGTFENGDPFQATRLSLSAHTGTHMDSMRHFIPGGRTMSDWTPADTIGQARVADVGTAAVIDAAVLAQVNPQPGERLLLRTRNSDRAWFREPFDPGFTCFTDDGAALLAERRVRTVGIDYLSVGNTSNGVVVHNHILGAGIWIIEGLYLGDVAPGDYEMLCLPVRLADADGVPCRVLLRPSHVAP